MYKRESARTVSAGRAPVAASYCLRNLSKRAYLNSSKYAEFWIIITKIEPGRKGRLCYALQEICRRISMDSYV